MSPAMPTLRQLTPPASLLADRPGGISAIGGTAVVRLARMADDSCAEVWVKMEAANPTGSYMRAARFTCAACVPGGRRRPWTRTEAVR